MKDSQSPQGSEQSPQLDSNTTDVGRGLVSEPPAGGEGGSNPTSGRGKAGGARSGAGRKRIPIDYNEIERYASLRFTDEKMASILGVTTRTIERWRRSDVKFAEASQRGQSLLQTARERYVEGLVYYLPEALQEPTARGCIERCLSATIRIWIGSEKPPGCLILQAALASADGSKIIREDLESTRHAVEVVLRKRMEQGVEQEELPPDADCAGLARYFVTVIIGLAVSAMSGIKRQDLLAIAETAMKVWPRQSYYNVAAFLLRFPKIKIAGVEGFVDFTEELSRLGLPPVEKVLAEAPDGRSMTFREFDSDPKIRDSAARMTGQFRAEPCERFDFGRALGFFKSFSSSDDPLEDLRQFWALVAPQGEAMLEKAITDKGGRDAFAALLRGLFQKEPAAGR